jgi:DNA invertase Pin-like site-specific DNA recombinase
MTIQAAIYARKSTEQRDRDEKDKSVAHQVKRSREFILNKGWAVNAACVFDEDDGISGAEFSKRQGLVRLLRALDQKPHPPFDVLVMADESRLGRETIETAFVLKQIIQAGVRVFFYLDDRERTLDSPMDKVMLAVTR